MANSASDNYAGRVSERCAVSACTFSASWVVRVSCAVSASIISAVSASIVSAVSATIVSASCIVSASIVSRSAKPDV